MGWGGGAGLAERVATNKLDSDRSCDRNTLRALDLILPAVGKKNILRFLHPSASIK